MLITVICCYVTISTLLQTKDEFRFIIPYVEFSKQVKGGRPLVLDTSVIIDGRIADVCDTRLIDTKLIVPRFVLQELQAIADSSDKLKRNRGRRGLDVLKRLQTNPKIELQMHDGNIPELRTGERIRVDERLVILAKALSARVVTNDFNLNKIAQLQGVDVINLNELANAMKTVALPGEVDAGAGREGRATRSARASATSTTARWWWSSRAGSLIGQEVAIVVTSVLQTPAGRMIFGRPDQRISGSSHTLSRTGRCGRFAFRHLARRFERFRDSRAAQGAGGGRKALMVSRDPMGSALPSLSPARGSGFTREVSPCFASRFWLRHSSASVSSAGPSPNPLPSP